MWCCGQDPATSSSAKPLSCHVAPLHHVRTVPRPRGGGHCWSCRAHLATQPRHRRSAAWPSRGLDPAPPCPARVGGPLRLPCRAAVPRQLRPAAELPPRDVPHLNVRHAFDCSVLQLRLLCPSGCIHVRPLPSRGVSVSAAPPHGFDRAVRVRPPRRIGPSAATRKKSRNSLGPAAASPHHDNSPKLAAAATNRSAPLRSASESAPQRIGPDAEATDSCPPPRHVLVALLLVRYRRILPTASPPRPGWRRSASLLHDGPHRPRCSSRAI